MRLKRTWLGAISMLAMSAVNALDFSKMRLTDRVFRGPQPDPKRHKKVKASGRSKQKYDPSRLIADRSSTIRKLQRWHRAGVIGMPEPDERAKMRHAWYRNQMAKEGQAL